MRNIILATDFSSCSKDALRYAIVLAQKTASQIVLLNSYSVPVADPNMTPYALEILWDEKEKEVENELKELSNDITSQKDIYGNSLKCERIYTSAKASESILNIAEEREDCLIVMGAHSDRKLKIFGSTVLEVVENSSVPVLVVPEVDSLIKLKKIVYTTDFIGDDLQILKWLVSFAELFDSEITVVHVDLYEELDRYETMISEMIKKCRLVVDMSRVKFHKINSDDPIEGLNNFIHANSINLLAVAKYKREFSKDLFHKSLTKQMIVHANIPLLVFHKLI